MLRREDPRSPPTTTTPSTAHICEIHHHNSVTLTVFSDYTNRSRQHSVECMPKLNCCWNANALVLDFPAPTTPPALNKLQCLSVQRLNNWRNASARPVCSTSRATSERAEALAGVAKVTENVRACTERVRETVRINSDSCYIIQATKMSVSCWGSSVNTPLEILWRYRGGRYA